MVYALYGVEVARVSLVDDQLAPVLDVFIQPQHRLIDCNTRFSGLTPPMLTAAAGALPFELARERFFEFVNADSILVGHSLESDLSAMRLVHEKVGFYYFSGSKLTA